MKYEKWSLGYWCLKQYINFANWLIHKKIIITGKEKIPKNKPVIFAPNHQNALSDPLAVLLKIPFQPVWLARADIFGKSKMIDGILKFMKIIPVYRIRDGKENLEKNEKTFTDSIKVLKHNSALALFPEGAHSAKRQMLMHKKAVPRIVFMAEENTGNQLDIHIVPTGIYYSHYWKFNRTVIVNFGDPIPVKDFMDQYAVNSNKAVHALKAKIHDSLLPLIININSKKHCEDFERICEMYGRHFLKQQNKKYSVLNLFKSDRLLVNRLDDLETEKPCEIEEIASESKHLHEVLKKFKIKIALVDGRQKHIDRIVLNVLILLAGLPIFVYGFVLNAVPFFIIDRVIRKKVRDKSFWSTFFLVAGIIIFPIFYLLELLAVSWLLPGIWLKIIFIMSLPFAGKLAFRWYILLRKTIGRCRILGLKWFYSKTFWKLLTEKESIFKKLDHLLLL